MILIGLDPAFRENGFAAAIFDPSDKDEPLRFIVFHDTVSFIGWAQNDAPERAFVYVENSNLDAAVYHLTPKMNARQAAAIGVAVGKNQAVSQLAVDLLRRKYGKDYVAEIAPNKKGGKVYARAVAMVDVLDLTKAKPTERVTKALKSEDCRSALMMLMRAKSQWRLKEIIYGVSL